MAPTPCSEFSADLGHPRAAKTRRASRGGRSVTPVLDVWCTRSRVACSPWLAQVTAPPETRLLGYHQALLRRLKSRPPRLEHPHFQV